MRHNDAIVCRHMGNSVIVGTGEWYDDDCSLHTVGGSNDVDMKAIIKPG